MGRRTRQSRKQERSFQVSSCRRPKEPSSVPVEVLGVIKKRIVEVVVLPRFPNNVEAEF